METQQRVELWSVAPRAVKSVLSCTALQNILVTAVQITQLLHQPMHIYKIYKILHIKTLKTLRHVSVLRPSSGSYNFLAKVTLDIVTCVVC